VVREVTAATQQILAVLDKSQQTEKYSAAPFLVNAGIQTLIDAQYAIAPNKVMVIDRTTILTGSFNFTKAAEERNAENLLVIKEALELGKAYEANVQAHAAHSHPSTRHASTAPPATEAAGEVYGNRNSMVSRVPRWKGYAGMTPASVVAFASGRCSKGIDLLLSSKVVEVEKPQRERVASW